MTEDRVDENWRTLMIEAQQGNKESYKIFLEQIVNSYIGNEKSDYSRPVLGAILTGLHNSLHTYDTKADFVSWLQAIIDFKVKEYNRYTKFKH